jgi:hypothetical protein
MPFTYDISYDSSVWSVGQNSSVNPHGRLYKTWDGVVYRRCPLGICLVRAPHRIATPQSQTGHMVGHSKSSLAS